MTQQQLIDYKVQQFLAKRDFSGLSAFINLLLADLPGTLKSVTDDVVKDKAQQMVNLNTAIAKLQDSLVSLNAASALATPITSTASVAK